MRVRSIRIDSFGGLRDRTIEDLGPGLNLIYGKNESGKTSLMEFIRSTMFGTGKKRDLYPIPQKTDSGSVSFVNDDGSILVLKRTYRSTTVSKGVFPERLGSMDYTNYCSVFAMTPEDLRNAEALSEIKSRFLTIPGGDRLPAVIDDLEKRTLLLLPKDRMTTTKGIGELLKRKEDLEDDIAKSKAANGRYSELYGQLSETEKQLAELEKTKMIFLDASKKMEIRTSQEQNIASLQKKKEEFGKLSASAVIKDDSKSRYDALVHEKDSSAGEYERLKKSSEDLLCSLEGHDPDRILRNEERIVHLNRNITYHSHIQNTKRTEQTAVAKKNPMGYILIAGGVVLIAVCAIVEQYIGCIGGIAVAGIGAFLTVRKTPAIKNEEPTRNDDIRSLERDLERVADDVGIDRHTFQSDVSYLYSLLESSKRYSMIAVSLRDARAEMNNAESDLRLFLSEFGGEEQFLKLVEDAKARKTLEIEIGQLSKSIESSGYDPEPVDNDIVEDPSSKITELNIQKGSIEAEMKSIIDTENTNRLVAQSTMLDSEISETVRNWGIMSLASCLIDRACDEFYDTVQPGVIGTANRYIGLMTKESYRLDIDPRDNNITVMNGDLRKIDKQWSTGLGDQIRLSLKMSVAKEIITESIPMILDDVLLTFDSDRKAGACKALMDLSNNMQILFFTCDTETMELMERSGCDKIITL